jgi:hypothetical protein
VIYEETIVAEDYAYVILFAQGCWSLAILAIPKGVEDIKNENLLARGLKNG